MPRLIQATIPGCTVSRHVMDWVQPEPLRLFCPDLTDVLEGREPFEALANNGDGTITDKITGIVWMQKSSEDKMDW